MPRKPKPKNTLTAGERVALFEAERELRLKELSGEVAVETSEKRNSTIEGLAGEKADERIVRAAEAKPEKKAKPQPQHATVTVDFSLPIGEIGAVHGMCNGPVSYGADITGLFREIGVPYVRYDGTDTSMSAYAVDCSRIFKNLDADPSLPENYDFAVTDKYVEAAYRAGARVIFRLGESYDPMFLEKKTVEIDNLNLLARVCGNIVRHYNQHWANGFSLDIEYFELWQHDPSADDEKFKKELATYETLANAIKLVDESVKVGGLCFDCRDAAVREFLRYCRKNHVPLDFLTVSCFGCDPEADSGEIERLSAYVRNLGCDAEIILGKWGYISDTILDGEPLARVLGGNSEKYAQIRQRIFEAQASLEGAAYAAAMLLKLSSIPHVRTACFYDAQPMLSPWCSLCDRYGRPQKPFYSFKAFGDLYRAKTAVLCESLQAEDFAHTGVYAAGAISEDGEGYVMLASYGGAGVVDLRLDGIPDNLYSVDVYMLDGVKNLSVGDPIPISGMKKRLLLNVSKYGVVVVKLY